MPALGLLISSLGTVPLKAGEPALLLAANSTSLTTLRTKELSPEPLDQFISRNLVHDEMPLLHQAIAVADDAALERMLHLGVDPNLPSPAGETPLCAAILAVNHRAVDLLLLHGANPNLPGLDRQPPLALASLRRHPDLIRLLLASGADPNMSFVSPVPKTIIERITIRDLKWSLESDRSVTPLMACASRGDVESTVHLLRYGAKAGRCTGKYKRYPINFAATQGYVFLMRVLLGRDPDSEPNLLVTVDLSEQKAWITQNGQVIDSTKVSTGRKGYSTPAGRFVVTDKHRSHTSTLYHVAMPWFMRLNCGAIGLHSGYVSGRPASHGCIRLPYEKAKAFFSVVSVGDEVEIID